jgi:hypothetical protein
MEMTVAKRKKNGKYVVQNFADDAERSALGHP